MMRIRSASSMLAGCTLALSQACAAAVITVGMNPGYPLATTGPGGSEGMYVDIMNAIAAEADARIDIQELPLPRLRNYLRAGTVSAAIAIPDAGMLVDATIAGTVMHFDVIALGRRGVRLGSIAELRGKRICLSRSSSMVPELYEDRQFLLREVSRHDSCPKMLDAGRVDFIITMRSLIPLVLARMGKSLADYGEPYVIKRVPVALLVSRKDGAGVMAPLRRALHRVQANGTIGAIKRKYRQAGIQSATRLTAVTVSGGPPALR